MIRINDRRGFTVIEVAVSLALLGLLAAVAIPVLNGYLAQRRMRSTAELFVALGYGLNNQNRPLGNSLTKRGFINAVVDATKTPSGTYPSRLRSLVIAITTADVDCRGGANTYTATKVTAWTNNAPFTDLLVTPGLGVTTPFGVIRDSVYKGAGNTANMVELRMDSVSTQDVQNLDYAIDFAYDSTAGRLRYIASAAGAANPDLHLVKYVLPAWTGC